MAEAVGVVKVDMDVLLVDKEVSGAHIQVVGILRLRLLVPLRESLE